MASNCTLPVIYALLANSTKLIQRRPKRPDSGHPMTVQTKSSVHSWALQKKLAKYSITQFIAHECFIAFTPHKTSMILRNCFLLIRRSLVRAQVEEPPKKASLTAVFFHLQRNELLR